MLREVREVHTAQRGPERSIDANRCINKGQYNKKFKIGSPLLWPRDLHFSVSELAIKDINLMPTSFLYAPKFW